MSRIAAPNVSEPPLVQWWQLPIVWMVLAGPAAVVVASFATLALAILNPDPIVDAPLAASKSELPAVAARNHLAAARR